VSSAASLQPVAVPGVVDPNPSHSLGRGGEAVALAVDVLVADEAQVGLVDQGGGVQGVAGGLRGHPRGGEPPQLVVNEREEVGGGFAVASRGGIEQAGDVGHDSRVYHLSAAELQEKASALALSSPDGYQHHNEVSLLAARRASPGRAARWCSVREDG
jgi:hypothetical protein